VGREGFATYQASQNQWIEAESPQELHGQFRGLGAESPVFFRRNPPEKNAPKFRRLYSPSFV
jgi:hypothetical protein